MGRAIAYTVRATCPSTALAAAYIEWLRGGHTTLVLRGGAESAMVVRLDAERAGDEPRVEVRYVFSTREVFDRYIREHAPVLRADGLKHFGPETGVRFERTVGEVM